MNINIFKLFFLFFVVIISMQAGCLAEEKTILKGNVIETIQQPETGIGVIGLRFIHQTGFPTYIEEVYPDSPAAKEGITKKDLIVAVDGVSTTNLNPDSVYQLLSGKPGTSVKVTIQRGSSTLTFNLVREDLAKFSGHIQQRYLTGPIAVPFDFKELFPFD